MKPAARLAASISPSLMRATCAEAERVNGVGRKILGGLASDHVQIHGLAVGQRRQTDAVAGLRQIFVFQEGQQPAIGGQQR